VPDAAASGTAGGFQAAAASSTAGNQPPHRTRNASHRVCAVPLFDPPTNPSNGCWTMLLVFIYVNTWGRSREKGELSVPGPLQHSYVRRATAHAHTIPNLRPEIWTKHCVTPSSIAYDSYFISISSLSLSLLEPDQSSPPHQ
jgi:hypothetical protein